VSIVTGVVFRNGDTVCRLGASIFYLDPMSTARAPNSFSLILVIKSNVSLQFVHVQLVGICVKPVRAAHRASDGGSHCTKVSLKIDTHRISAHFSSAVKCSESWEECSKPFSKLRYDSPTIYAPRASHELSVGNSHQLNLFLITVPNGDFGNLRYVCNLFLRLLFVAE